MSLGAWRCHGATNSEMVEKLAEARIIKSPQVKEAFLKVDRSNFLVVDTSTTSRRDTVAEAPYMDAPQPIGCGQTISAPHMHAYALEEILPTLIKFSSSDDSAAGEGTRTSPTSTNNNKEGELRILDVGCGSGYLTTVLGRMLDRSITNKGRGPIPPLHPGSVYGIEVVDALVTLSRNNILKENKDLFDSDTVTVMQADGWKGLPKYAPYHAIHVGAAAETFPKDLMMQLHPNGGIMVIPVGPNGGMQYFYRIERIRDNEVYEETDFDVRALLGVRYVPLVHSDL